MIWSKTLLILFTKAEYLGAQKNYHRSAIKIVHMTKLFSEIRYLYHFLLSDINCAWMFKHKTASL